MKVEKVRDLFMENIMHAKDKTRTDSNLSTNNKICLNESSDIPYVINPEVDNDIHASNDYSNVESEDAAQEQGISNNLISEESDEQNWPLLLEEFVVLLFGWKSICTNLTKRYKATLGARGFNPTHGIGCFETFSPVARKIDFKVVIALSVELFLDIEHFDITAFLHGGL